MKSLNTESSPTCTLIDTGSLERCITVYRERVPEGAWLGFRPALMTDRADIGVAEVVQFDRAGRIGRSLQALVANG